MLRFLDFNAARGFLLLFKGGFLRSRSFLSRSRIGPNGREEIEVASAFRVPRARPPFDPFGSKVLDVLYISRNPNASFAVRSCTI